MHGINWFQKRVISTINPSVAIDIETNLYMIKSKYLHRYSTKDTILIIKEKTRSNNATNIVKIRVHLHFNDD